MTWGHIERGMQITIAAIIAYFLVSTVSNNWNDLLTYSVTVHRPFHLIGAIGTILISYLLIWGRWHLTARYLGENLSKRTSGMIYAFFQVSTYVPGGVWQYLQLNYLAEKTDLRKKTATAAMIQHQILGIIGAGTIFVAFGGAALLPHPPSLVVLLVIIGIVGVSAYPPLLRRAVNPILHRLGQEKIDVSMGYRQILLLTVIASSSWMLTATGFALLTQAFTGAALTPLLLAVFPGAWLTGFLLLLAPGGIGIREAAIVSFLSEIVSHPEAILLAIVSRLWTLLPEIVFGGIFLYVTLTNR